MKKKINVHSYFNMQQPKNKNKLFKDTSDKRFVKVFIRNSATKQTLLLITY